MSQPALNSLTLQRTAEVPFAIYKWASIYQSPDEVVEEALRVLAKGGGLTVPGALNKFSVFAERLIPRRLVPRLVAKMSRA